MCRMVYERLCMAHLKPYKSYVDLCGPNGRDFESLWSETGYRFWTKLQGCVNLIAYERHCVPLKVTVHVETDQYIEIQIFAEYKYTFNKL